MSRTYKKLSPKVKVDGKEEWQVDEKGLKTAEQKRQAHHDNKKDRKEARLDAEQRESRDFQPRHSASSRYTRAFIGDEG